MPDVRLFDSRDLRRVLGTFVTGVFTVYTPDIISAVRCPIAILSGTLDQVAPHRDHAERLLAAAPWAKSFSFEDCGHMLKLEAPVTFNSIVRQMAAEMPGESLAATRNIMKGD